MSFYPRRPNVGQRVANDATEVTTLERFLAEYTVTPAGAADADAVANALDQPVSGTTVFTTGITNPDVPRNLTVVGEDTDCTGDVVIIGTNMAGASITETFALNGTTPVVGAKAFKTVTSVEVPARAVDGAENVDVGYGDKLGLPHKLTRNTVFAAYLGDVKEGTAPTVVVDADELEKNTFDLNSALDGSEVKILYFV